MSRKTQSIVINRTEIPVVFERVPIGEVTLDPDNPRIRRLVRERYGDSSPTENDLIEIIRAPTAFQGLMRRVREHGGIHDPILIRHSGMIVEGNSRAAIYKLLARAAQANSQTWDTIPVHRLSADTPDRLISLYRASVHVARKTNWITFAQAEELFELQNTHGLSWGQIALATGLTEMKVTQLIDAYMFTRDEIAPLVEPAIQQKTIEKTFGHAREFMTKKALADLCNDPKARKSFAEAVAAGKISQREVWGLSPILKSEKAVEKLKREGYKAAKKEIAKTSPQDVSPVLKEVLKLKKSLGNLTADDLELLKQNGRAREILTQLKSSIDSTISVIEGNGDG